MVVAFTLIQDQPTIALVNKNWTQNLKNCSVNNLKIGLLMKESGHPTFDMLDITGNFPLGVDVGALSVRIPSLKGQLARTPSV